MVNIKLFSFIFLIPGFLGSVSGQEDDRDKIKNRNHYLEIGLGIDNHGIRDQGTSPLIYSGYLPSLHLEYLFSNDQLQIVAENNFSMGKLTTRNYPETDGNKATSYNDELSLRAFYELGRKQHSKIRYLAGGDLNLLGNIRINDKYNNASLNYEFIASLAPAFLLDYKTGWQANTSNDAKLINFKRRDREIHLCYELSLPVISDILRPGFVTISDFVDNKSTSINLNNFRFVSIDKLFIMNNRFTVYYILHNLNMLKLEYRLEFLNYHQTVNPVSSFHSSLMLSIVFRFSNNRL